MKILHLIPSLRKGGAERLALHICKELSSRADVEVKLFTFHKQNDYAFLTKDIDWEIVPARVVPSITGRSIVEVDRLQQAIEDYQPDIIHSHLFETEIVLSQISYPEDKYFVHFHNNMVQFENWKWRNVFNKIKLTNLFEKRIVLSAYSKRRTKFIAISESSMNYIQEVLPPTFEKILLHNAVDLTRFNYASAEGETFQIVIVGSLVRNKDHQLAIETVHELTKRNRKVHLHILGEGPERIRLEHFIQEFNLASEITLHGSVDHPEKFLEKSHLYIHTAHQEAFGLTILEAMACGLSVVCTDGGGNRDLIKEGLNGSLVKERDPKLLANKIEVLIENEELRAQMGKNARSFAQKFGMVEYIEQLLRIYKE
jgi:glycosyltransferase involved in cell wall biosynthesis